MNNNSKAIQMMGREVIINKDAENRMNAGCPGGDGLFGRTKYLVVRAITAAKHRLWLNLFSVIILLIAIVIAIIFKADIAAIIS